MFFLSGLPEVNREKKKNKKPQKKKKKKKVSTADNYLQF